MNPDQWRQKRSEYADSVDRDLATSDSAEIPLARAETGNSVPDVSRSGDETSRVSVQSSRNAEISVLPNQ